MPNRAERRASPAKYPTSLEAWDHDRVLKGVLIPSATSGPGFLVDYEMPNLQAIAKMGDLPNPLAEMAIRADWDTEFSPLRASNEERETYFDLMCHVIAWGLRKPNAVEKAGSLEAAAAWVSRWTVEQQMALWMRSQHMVSADDIIAAADSMKEAKGSDLANVADLGEFREVGRGPAAAEDGASDGAGT